MRSEEHGMTLQEQGLSGRRTAAKLLDTFTASRQARFLQNPCSRRKDGMDQTAAL